MIKQKLSRPIGLPLNAGICRSFLQYFCLQQWVISKQRDLYFKLLYSVPVLTCTLNLPELQVQVNFLQKDNLLFFLTVDRGSCQMQGLQAFGGPIAPSKDFHSLLTIVQILEPFIGLSLVGSSLWFCKYHHFVFYQVWYHFYVSLPSSKFG